MKKGYEVPQMDIVKFSMDTDIMTASVDEVHWDMVLGASEASL